MLSLVPPSVIASSTITVAKLFAFGTTVAWLGCSSPIIGGA